MSPAPAAAEAMRHGPPMSPHAGRRRGPVPRAAVEPRAGRHRGPVPRTDDEPPRRSLPRPRAGAAAEALRHQPPSRPPRGRQLTSPPRRLLPKNPPLKVHGFGFS